MNSVYTEEEMKAHKRWGRIAIAAIFAVAAIGVASFNSYAKGQAGAAGGVEGFSNWKNVSSTVGEKGATRELSQDIFDEYTALVASGNYTEKERGEVLAAAVAEHVTPQNIVPNISPADLNVQAGVSLDTYAKLFAVIMNEAGKVKEYEPDVFARLVVSGDMESGRALAAASDLYKRIAAALLVMEVPPELSTEHLEVVKSVATLAKAVENMAAWNRDPIEALVLVDTFNRSEIYVEMSVEALTAAVENRKKQP